MRANFQNGAGDGNRTHVVSLEGWSSTIELHPHKLSITLPISFLPWWRGEDSNLRRRSRQIYSLIPLATREPLHENRTLFVKQGLLSTVKLFDLQIDFAGLILRLSF